ncbi:hypothetical protein SAMN05660909_00591 [Chitinophaga terrae (ex Kim and Jung 2007)]|uniref:DUF983 domain-containing protein n=1 Tax=Chitinophaga terrae (ex Kim and Jung 2007) TaxID=408074 RepID=A0A1H3Y1B4_9BACT|nr:DUF983 domain-containing protein [Chitinophaga terrae (ex Kim and Jung 2007)]MDQ0108110.1 endogenous inhibitor of DNA gyrase (YacG/DUF329 family) [Chitinophaga terrae (ex Kim and Jung 2007)]GEP89485.1 hypothetical protein CTE07_11300 [Chitinophaga terrae (ex Kim and Jung 2007)]SEA04602.1 hypothetical protein SAMN05660909_00591 [Chitinophaga terrae (ex Kim and Jung 2007)]
MCADKNHEKPNLLKSILGNKCARCRRGSIYKTKNPYHPLKECMEMPEKCPVCGQQIEVEIGFYYGTGYVSYALSVALCVASFIAWWVFFGFSLYDNRIYYWLIANAILLLGMQPLLMRWARTIWMAFFVYYDKDWPDTAEQRRQSNISIEPNI